MKPPALGKPARKPRTEAERTAMRKQVEDRVKKATPAQREAFEARRKG